MAVGRRAARHLSQGRDRNGGTILPLLAAAGIAAAAAFWAHALLLRVLLPPQLAKELEVALGAGGQTPGLELLRGRYAATTRALAWAHATVALVAVPVTWGLQRWAVQAEAGGRPHLRQLVTQAGGCALLAVGHGSIIASLVLDHIVLEKSGFRMTDPVAVDFAYRPSVLMTSLGVQWYHLAALAALVLACVRGHLALARWCTAVSGVPPTRPASSSPPALWACFADRASHAATRSGSASHGRTDGSTSPRPRRLLVSGTVLLAGIAVTLLVHPPSWRRGDTARPVDATGVGGDRSQPTGSDGGDLFARRNESLLAVERRAAATVDGRGSGRRRRRAATPASPWYLVPTRHRFTSSQLLQPRSSNPWLGKQKLETCSLAKAVRDAKALRTELGERPCYPVMLPGEAPQIPANEKASILWVISDGIRAEQRPLMSKMLAFLDEYRQQAIAPKRLFSNSPGSDGAAFAMLYSMFDNFREVIEPHTRLSPEPKHPGARFVSPLALEVLRANGYRIRALMTQGMEGFLSADWMFTDGPGTPGVRMDTYRTFPEREFMATLDATMDSLDEDMARGQPTLYIVWLEATHYSYMVPPALRNAVPGRANNDGSFESYERSIKATDHAIFDHYRGRWEKYLKGGRLILAFGSDHGEAFAGEHDSSYRGHGTQGGPWNTINECVHVLVLPKTSRRASPPSPSIGSLSDIMPTILDYLGLGDDVLPRAVYTVGRSWLVPEAKESAPAVTVRSFNFMQAHGTLMQLNQIPAVTAVLYRPRGLEHPLKMRFILRDCPHLAHRSAADQPPFCAELHQVMSLDDESLQVTEGLRGLAEEALHVYHCQLWGRCPRLAETSPAAGTADRATSAAPASPAAEPEGPVVLQQETPVVLKPETPVALQPAAPGGKQPQQQRYGLFYWAYRLFSVSAGCWLAVAVLQDHVGRCPPFSSQLQGLQLSGLQVASAPANTHQARDGLWRR